MLLGLKICATAILGFIAYHALDKSAENDDIVTGYAGVIMLAIVGFAIWL